MIRLLTGLNEADAAEELRAAGVMAPAAEQIELLCNGPALLFPAELAENVSEGAVRSKAGCRRISETNGPLLLAGLSLAPPQFLHSLADFLREGSATQLVLRRTADRLAQKRWLFQAQGRSFTLEKPLIMGVLNVTPDSFSDGGAFSRPEEAIQHAMSMLEEGADIIDIGGESTRPGAAEVSVDEEWRRIAPVLAKLAKENCLLSIDTYKAEIARRALNEGVHIVNDISGLTFDENLPELLREWNVPVVLMHLQGRPRHMQVNPHYDHLMRELTVSLWERCSRAGEHGISQIIVDPGIGFGKRLEDNYEIIRRLKELSVLGVPVLLGTSRKSFIGKYLGVDAAHRVPGTIAGNLCGMINGAQIIRVHDVWQARQSLDIMMAIAVKKA